MRRQYNQQLDTGYAWVVLTCAFACHMITASSWSTFGLYYVEFLHNFPDEKPLLAWMWAILGATWGIVGVVVGKLITSFGCRKIAITGAVLGALGFFASSFCHDFVFICLWYGLLVGFGNCAIVSSAYVAVQQSFDRRRALANGLSSVGGNAGLFAFPPLFEFLIGEFGWRGSFMIQSGVYLNVIVAASLFYPHHKEHSHPDETKQTGDIKPPQLCIKETGEHPDVRPPQDNTDSNHIIHADTRPPRDNTDSNHIIHADTRPPQDNTDSNHIIRADTRPPQNNTDAAADNETRTKDRDTRWKQLFHLRKLCRDMCSCDMDILRDYHFLLYAIGYFCYQYGHHTPMIFIVPRAASYGISPQMAAWLMSAWAIGGTVGFILVGWIADKWSRVAMCGFSSLLAGIFTAGTYWFHSFSLLCCYSVGFGLASGGFYATNVPALVDVVGPNKVADANGMVLTPSGVAGLIAAPFASWLTLQTGSYYAAFVFAGSVMLLGGVLLLAVAGARWRKNKHPRTNKQTGKSVTISYNAVPTVADVSASKV